MPYWCACQLLPRQERLALHMLQEVEHYSVYAPRLREHRMVRGRRVEVRPLLFINYIFIRVELQWSRARWCAGVNRIVLDGVAPARVPDQVIAALKRREFDGAIELSKRGLQRLRKVNLSMATSRRIEAAIALKVPRLTCEEHEDSVKTCVEGGAISQATSDRKNRIAHRYKRYTSEQAHQALQS
jgi:transcription antitermination factor NusG